MGASESRPVTGNGTTQLIGTERSQASESDVLESHAASIAHKLLNTG